MKKYLYIIFAILLVSCSSSDGGSGNEAPLVNTPPSVPTLLYPTDNQLCVEEQIDFDWYSSIDNENDNINYEVQIATNITFTEGLQNRTITQTSVSLTLEKGKAHYWRVRAKDNKGGVSDYSQIWKFYTEGEGTSNHIPFAPTLIQPSLGSNISDAQVNLTWTSSDVDNNPLVFDVYFGESNPPDLMLSDISDTSYSVDLNPESTYYWRIVVKDNHGAEAIGQIWNFNTD